MTPEQIQSNINTLIQFPTSGDTQIKGDGAGNLYHTTSFRNGFGFWGTKFTITSDFIEKTAKASFSNLDRELFQLRKQFNGLKAAQLRERILQFKQNFSKERLLLNGIKYIFKKYSTNHKKTNLGLQKVSVLLSDGEAHIQKIQRCFKDFITNLQAWNDDLRVYIDPYLETLKEESNTLYLFCKNFCPDVSYEEAMNLIDEGRNLYDAVFKGDRNQVCEERKTANREIATLVWYLVACALNQGKNFKEGTIVIEDPGNRLYLFFDSYTQSLNEETISYRINPNFVLPALGSSFSFGRLHHSKTGLFQLDLEPKCEISWIRRLFSGIPSYVSIYQRLIPEKIRLEFCHLLYELKSDKRSEWERQLKLYGLTFIYNFICQLDAQPKNPMKNFKEIHIYQALYLAMGNEIQYSRKKMKEIYVHEAMKNVSEESRIEIKKSIEKLKEYLREYRDLDLGYRYGNEVILVDGDFV